MRIKDTFHKRFIAAASDTLTLETIQTISKTRRQRLRVLTLKGTWRANEYNELTFEAAGSKGPPQTYTFKGAWKINKNQQIEYVGGEGPDVLTFKGYWSISSATKLVYLLEGSSTSRFEFKAQLESASMHPKEGQIRYRIGIGARKSRLTGSGKLIILYGEWKFGRNLGLIFRMDYGKGRFRAVEFGAEVSFSRGKVFLSLHNEAGEPLGITLGITHKLFKAIDAEVFMRLKYRRSRYGPEAGVTIPF